MDQDPTEALVRAASTRPERLGWNWPALAPEIGRLSAARLHRAPTALTELNLLGDAPGAEGGALTAFGPFA